MSVTSALATPVFVHPRNLHRQHRMIESLQREIVDGAAFGPLSTMPNTRRGNHAFWLALASSHAATPRLVTAADRGVFQPLLEADLAEASHSRARCRRPKPRLVAAVAPLTGSGAPMVSRISTRHLHRALDVILELDRGVERIMTPSPA